MTAKTTPPAPLNLGTASLAELAKLPSGGDTLLPKTKQARDRGRQQEVERAEREQRNRTIGGRKPAEPPIPDDVLQQATFPRLEVVDALFQRREHCATERAMLETRHAAARLMHERNRTARAESRAVAKVRGVTPPSDDGADRREADAIRALEEEIDVNARTEQHLKHQERETLANEVRTEVWPAQQRIRREGLEQMIEGCRLLAGGQARVLAGERAGHQERGRVIKALQLELGPSKRVIPGAAIEQADPRDPHGARHGVRGPRAGSG